MEKEFFEKYMNISEEEMLKGCIYSECRIMDKEDIYNWVYQDELKLKKQQEINQKAIEYIKGIDFNYLEETYQISTKEYLETILEILEDKEV